MDQTELTTMVKAYTTTLTALSEVFKICRAGDKTLNGNLGMGDEDGIVRTFQKLQGPGKEFFTHAKAFNDLITKGAATTAPAPLATGTNNRTETSNATVE